ncbi:MAG: hypothetical protein QF842_02405 [Candidatus Marinimicrobia bacterium]|jgi:hypothetical protein|nr:hypothetical protein [Candidatus Neomarinimicrobiota bacterium]MDP6611485.1 hypothetical protein [Candidatus Neomarinimicrobiota bacterium]|tara:strand:- start:8306 stop:8968 length:663 start_codon:yes stop_codon:yes gene_type:complete
MKRLFKPLAIFLSANLLLVQVSAAVPQTKSGKINVGYVGEKLEGIPDGYKKLVRQKMLGLVNQNYYEFHNPVDLSDKHGEAVSAVLAHNKDSFNVDLATLSEAAALDYIFFTSLSNISDDDRRVMLKGEVVRYNRETNDVFRHEVLTYAEDLDLHIRAMKTELVETIPHSVHGLSRNRVIVLIGVATVLAFAMSQSFSELAKYLKSGDDDDSDTKPPVGH